VKFLTKRLEELIVADRIPEDTERVYSGAWITLVDEEEKNCRYQIVGPMSLI